jgi:threonine dehydrogenase-like Zn-dependent dehydrogenase
VVALETRRRLALSLGADAAVAPSDALAGELGDLSDGLGFDVAIDCSGADAARRTCLAAAREWGRVAFVGEGGTLTVEVSPNIIHKQLTVHGSWVCSIGQMEDLVELLVRWDLHPDRMVTDRFALEDAGQAYELADSGEAGKVSIVWE